MSSAQPVVGRGQVANGRGWQDGMLLALVYLLAVVPSWRRWTDPLVDAGRQLYIPWRMLEGDLLYRDVADVSGPLGAGVNAVVFAVAGVSLESLVLFNLGLVALHAILLCVMFRELAGRLAGVLAASVFLLVFAFAHPVLQANFNWVTPYAYGLCYGLLLATLCLWLVMRELREAGSGGRSLGAGLCAGLVLLSKPEVFGALVAALGAAVWVLPICGCRTFRGREFLAGAALAPLGAFLAFLRDQSPADALLSVLAAFRPLVDTGMVSTPYYAWVSGFDEPALNISRLVLLALPLALAAWSGTLLGRLPLRRAGEILLTLFLLLLLPTLLLRATGDTWLVQHGTRPLPLLVLVGSVLVGTAILREQHPDRRRILGCWFIYGVFALVLLGKIVLAARIFHYGFALALPGTLFVLALVASPPAGLLPRCDPATLRWGRTAVAGLLLAVAAAHVQASLAHYARKTMTLGTGADAMVLFDPALDPRGPEIKEFLAWSRKEMPPRATLLVLPDGAMLNYLLRRSAGVPYHTLPQPDLVAWGESTVLATYRARPPDYIVLTGQSNRLYGSLGDPQFGPSIAAWIRATYAPCARFAAATREAPGAGLTVLGLPGKARCATALLDF